MLTPTSQIGSVLAQFWHSFPKQNTGCDGGRENGYPSSRAVPPALITVIDMSFVLVLLLEN